MSVTDHKARRRPKRIRWLFLVSFSYTLGVVSAATLFAFAARIPIPIKITPTRGAGDILSAEPNSIESKIEFQDKLQSRSIVNLDNKEPVRATVPEAKLPVREDGSATEAEIAITDKPVKISAPTGPLSYFVQAGAFADNNVATTLSNELNDLGLKAQVRESSETEGDILYRVVVGPYIKASDAETARAQLALGGRSSTMLRLPAN